MQKGSVKTSNILGHNKGRNYGTYSNINEIEAILLKHRLLMRRRNASNVLLGWLTPTVQCHTSHRHHLQPRVRNLTSFHSFYCCPAVLQFYCAPVSN